MIKKLVALALVVSLTGGFGTAYAGTNSTSNTSPVSIEVISPEQIADSAGVLPDSRFYGIERELEQLKLAITRSEEKLAALKAQFATERAAEVAMMTTEGKEEFAHKATTEYMELLASAAEHLNTAIDVQEDMVQIEVINDSYRTSEEILKTVLDKAPEEAKLALESALAEQDKALAAVNGFHAAKQAFFAAKHQLQQAKSELKAAKQSGDAEAIRLAEEKVQAAEALKDELEGLKDAAESSKEEVKSLAEQAQKGIVQGDKKLEQANKKLEKVEEKAAKDARKLEEKAKKREAREAAKAKKEEEKLKKASMRAEEKADFNQRIEK